MDASWRHTSATGDSGSSENGGEQEEGEEEEEEEQEGSESDEERPPLEAAAARNAGGGRGKSGGRGAEEEQRNASSAGKGGGAEALDSKGRRRKRSRWGPELGEPGEAQDGKQQVTARKRMSRWGEDARSVLPADVLKQLTEAQDPEVEKLNTRLAEIGRRLITGEVLEGEAAADVSASVEPLYDYLGRRVSKRKLEAIKKLQQERLDIFDALAKKIPGLMPSGATIHAATTSTKAPKFTKKVHIPVKEYPDYNFIGLILGPRGLTQKQMESESGAKVLIRGRGFAKSDKEQQKHDLKLDSSDKDDLHVLIEAETEESVEKAARMVAKLLVPLEDGKNEHKRAQLRQLAMLNGTLKDNEPCTICGQNGHQQVSCPQRIDTLCRICGKSAHSVLACPMIQASMPGNTETLGPLICKVCGLGHTTIDCPKISLILGNKVDVICQICGEGGHSTAGCRKIGSVLGNNLGTSTFQDFTSGALCRVCGVGGHSVIDCPTLGSSQRMKMDALHLPSQSALHTEAFCRICGDIWHSTASCPKLSPSHNLLFKSNAPCRLCGSSGHSTVDCPITGSVEGNNKQSGFLVQHQGRSDHSSGWLMGSNSQRGSTLAVSDLKGDIPYFSSETLSLAQGGMGHSGMKRTEMAGAAHIFDSIIGQRSSPFYPSHSGTVSKSHNSLDKVQLIVENLPVSIGDLELIKMFSPFGSIDDAKVIKDSLTGVSKGYGVVSYSNPTCAAEAVQVMNGCCLQSKILAVSITHLPGTSKYNSQVGDLPSSYDHYRLPSQNSLGLHPLDGLREVSTSTASLRGFSTAGSAPVDSANVMLRTYGVSYQL